MVCFVCFVIEYKGFTFYHYAEISYTKESITALLDTGMTDYRAYVYVRSYLPNVTHKTAILFIFTDL